MPHFPSSVMTITETIKFLCLVILTSSIRRSHFELLLTTIKAILRFKGCLDNCFLNVKNFHPCFYCSFFFFFFFFATYVRVFVSFSSESAVNPGLPACRMFLRLCPPIINRRMCFSLSLTLLLCR